MPQSRIEQDSQDCKACPRLPSDSHALPEEAGAKEYLNDSRDKEDNFPARTGLHRSPVGYKWKEIYQRGDEFYDWDGHAFHFIGGLPKNADGSLALYTPKEQDEYLRELAESLKKGVQP